MMAIAIHLQIQEIKFETHVHYFQNAFHQADSIQLH